MSTPQTPPRDQNEPTPEKIAGVAVCMEGVEDVTVKPRRFPNRLPGSESNGEDKPTPDNLAGVPVSMEGKEDVTFRPRRPIK
jgi:hypothetical protein